MTEEWVSFWYQCLALNMDYDDYCDAKVADDYAKCDALEARFECIAKIYQDFGKLERLPNEGMQSEQWQHWFEPRQHLFTVSAIVIPDPTKHVMAYGHLLLDVPLQNDIGQTVSLVNQLLTDYYSRNQVLTSIQPKYTLHLKDGKLAHGFQQVRQACLSVARSYRYDLNTLEELRHIDAVTQFVRHEIDNLSWSLDPRALKELMETGTLSEQRLDSFKSMLNRCRRDFVAFSRNAIRGRFPDATPFKSDVFDIF